MHIREKKSLTLPKGKEDDRFNHEKFEHRAVRAEQVSGGEVEEEERVQGQADWDIVDDGHIQISTGHTVTEERESGNKHFLLHMMLKITVNILKNSILVQ